MSEAELPDDVKNPPKFENVWPEPEVIEPKIEAVEPALPLEFPEVHSYTVELRKGDLHDLKTEESTQVPDLEGVANVVRALRSHSTTAHVSWSAPGIIAGTCRGLAPKGVVYEICVIPAVTIDA